MRKSEFPLNGLSGEFAQRRVERAYRHWIWNETASTVRVALYLYFIAIWIFVYNDYVFVGPGAVFAGLIGLRVVGTALFLWLIRLTYRRSKMRQVEVWLAPWLGMGCLFTLVVLLTRPASYMMPAVQHMAGMLTIYLFTPFQLPIIAGLLVATAFADLAIFGLRGAGGPELLVLGVSLIMVNCMGYLASRRLNVLRRQQFVYRLTERRARKVLLHEISERRRAEGQLDDARRQAESANAAKSAFLAAMSHEIRTPLTGVLGFAQLLGETSLSQGQREHLKVIERSGRNLTRLLNDILDLSKVEAGRLTISSEPFDILDSVTQTVRLAAPKAEARGVQIRLHRPETTGPIWLVGDADRLQQIVGNLIDNALKYAKRSDVDISLAIGPEENDMRSLMIAVEDRGPGIAEALKESIFEPYVLGDAHGLDGSAGLGLAICRRLLELMGGTIGISDRTEGGACFTVALTLPIDGSGAVRVVAPVRIGQSRRAILDVLLVDDDEVNRLLITTVLGRQGHRVEIATDGQQGVELAVRRRFDVILMDMRMPVMDGIEAIAAIRGHVDAASRFAPVLAMTANVMDSQIAAYRMAGADGVVAKPIDFGLLQQELDRVTEKDAPVFEPVAADDGGLLDPRSITQLIETLGDEGAAKAEAQFRDAAPLLLSAIMTARAGKDAALSRRLGARAIAAAESLGLVGFARALSADTPAEQLEPLLMRSLEALRDAQRRPKRGLELRSERPHA